MLQNKLLILLLALTPFAFSQEKKADTVFVYEEVIIHDTVFLEKPLIRIDKAVFTSENNKKDKLELTQNGKIFQIPVDTLVLVTDKKKAGHEKSWFFGGRLLTGIADNSLFKKMDASKTTGLGLGIWVKKQCFLPNFSIGFGIDGLYWMSSFSFNATQNDSALNGYYFTGNKNPKLFQSIDNKHFQVQIPLQVYYRTGRFTPSAGIFAGISNYKSTFLGTSGSLPLTFNRTQVFRAEALQAGYLLELQYAISSHIAVSVHFSSGKSGKMVFTDKDDKDQSFKIKTGFTENKGLLQLIYSL